MPTVLTLGRRSGLASPVPHAPIPHAPGASARVGPGFLAAYAAAQVGAVLAFAPLLQILVPLKAAAIDPQHKTVLLGQAMLLGAVAASGFNLLAGAASDRTRSRFGRRRPWMVGGIVGTLLAYALIAHADSGAALVVGLVLFQALFNAFFAALAAAGAERTPDVQKGRLSALASLGMPLGSALGVGLVGGLVLDPDARFAVLGLLVAALALPFALGLREPPPGAPAAAAPAIPRPRVRGDFVLALGGRVLTLTAHTALHGFGLFLLQERWSRLHAPGSPFASLRPEQALAALLAAATCANVAAALLSGWLSDRLGRRKPFVALGAAGSGAALALAAVAGNWWSMAAAFLAFGCAAGCYCTTDNALVLQVLPSRHSTGRDLGVVNLTNTLPQLLAPLLAMAVVHGGHPAYAPMLLIAGAAALAGAASIFPIRTVR